MLSVRVIPVLLLKNKGLVKTTQFKNPNYIGDPINAVKIFNEKEVDELVFLDITATKEKRKPNLDYLREIATECFMPLGYGGAIQTIEDIKNILSTGIEKAIINSAAVNDPQFVKEATQYFGSSTIVVCIDYKKDLFGRLRVYTEGGNKKSSYHPLDFAKMMAAQGVGEIIIQSIERDGMMQGYDVSNITQVVTETDIPIIACGGAGSVQDLKTIVNSAKVSGVAAGSLFVYKSLMKGVLINYPSQTELKQIQNS